MKTKKSFKTILLFTIVCLLFATFSTQAKIGDKIGLALHTDIVAYINNYAIPSYCVNGTSVVVAEDLSNFGFDVIWNAENRTLSIEKAYKPIYEMYFTKTEKTGSFFSDILQTDIGVYAAGNRITSYALNGYTMIPIEELTMFGDVVYNDTLRSLFLNVSDMKSRSSIQVIEKSKIGAPSASSYLISDGSGMGFYTNSANGIKLLWEGKNNTGKVINYYTCNFTMYNPVGDFAYDEIKHTPFVHVKYVGPINVGENLLVYSVIGYSHVCSKVVLTDIDVEYADKTKENISYGYFANYETLWHE